MASRKGSHKLDEGLGSEAPDPVVTEMAGFAGSESVVTEMAGFARCCLGLPGGGMGIPAAFR
jgi:hypothetical protein